MKTRVARLTTALLFLILIGSATAALALPQADQGSSASSSKTKHSRKKKAESASAEKTTKSNSKLDLNTASKGELDALPGIGDTYAQKIIEGRPYTSKSDLVKKGVLPSSSYDKIKDEVTAHRTKKEASESSGATATPASSSNGNPTSGAASTEGTASKRNKSENAGETAKSNSDGAAQAPPEKGMVWVNLDSGVYHHEGDRWYGKTKHGKYMSEADAQKAGYRSAKTSAKKEE
jgi:DNA uptake protein ComE-like DNA-binding protein